MVIGLIIIIIVGKNTVAKANFLNDVVESTGLLSYLRVSAYECSRCQ